MPAIQNRRLSRKTQQRIYNKFNMIETAEDLRKNHLTLHDYNVLLSVLNAVLNSESHRTYTINSSVAEWCRKAGLTVIDPHGEDYTECVNYNISLYIS